MLTGTIIFLTIVTCLLTVPLTLTYRLAWKEKLSADIQLAWAFGLLRTNLSPGVSAGASGEDAPGREQSDRRGETKDGKGNVMAVIRDRAFRRRLTRFLSDIWRAVHKQNVRLLVRLGLGDPADTGQLWALLGPLSGAMSRVRDIRIVIEPDFLDSTLDVESSGTLRLIPLRILMIVFGAVVSPSAWRGWKLMRNGT